MHRRLSADVARLGGTAFVLVAVAVVGGLAPGAFDHEVIEHVGGMSVTARAAWAAASDVLAYVMGGAAALTSLVLTFRARRWDLVALVLLAVAAVGLNDLVVKPEFGTARPPIASSPSGAFPSGHTLTALCLGGTLLVAGTLREEGNRPGVVAAVAAVALLAGVSRVLAGEHMPIDVVGAWALGTAIVGALVRAAQGPVRRRRWRLPGEG